MDIVEQYKSITKDLGCSDGSCIFKKRTGMVTNGGCGCFAAYKATKPEIMKLRHIARMALEMSVEIEKLRKEDVESTTLVFDMSAERNDYKEAYEDTKRVARLIDVALCGEENAAAQASLCDLIPIAKKLRAENDALRARSEWGLNALTSIYKEAKFPDENSLQDIKSEAHEALDHYNKLPTPPKGSDDEA